MIKLHHGKCQDVLKGFEENSIDAIVTDPPYGLSFMGKKWDYDVPSVEIWKEALRVLKPGGHALIFAGSRTQHRMAINIEDAGFFLKDTIMWIYGSGFPKSTDISKQIDKSAGAEREVVGTYINRQPTGNAYAQDKWTKDHSKLHPIDITKPATPAAQLWNGYGTALKPAYEPIIVAMKPNDGTYANNALKHGVAGINIDGCRIHSDDSQGVEYKTKRFAPGASVNDDGKWKQEKEYTNTTKPGRFPANIIHDGSEEVLRLFPGTKSGKDRNPAKNSSSGFTGNGIRTEDVNYGDSGSAARFFYTAKASKSERNKGIASHVEVDGEWQETGGNNHPTVKPLSLIRYLMRLVKMPTETIVLDNFMGSGTFGEAAHLEGVSFVGIEMELPSFKIAEERINTVTAQLTF